MRLLSAVFVALETMLTPEEALYKIAHITAAEKLVVYPQPPCFREDMRNQFLYSNVAMRRTFRIGRLMFGDQPALTPPELVYQRMLASDPVETAEQAQKFLKERTLIAYYEEVLIGGLKLAHADAKRGLLDDERLQRIRDATAEIVDDLSAHEDPLGSIPELVPDDDKQAPVRQITAAEKLSTLSSRELPAQWQTAKPVLCIPGLGPLDEAMALILAQLIERQGIGARSERADALSMSRIFSLDTKDVALICLCYVANPTSAQVRYAIRRLRRKAPEAFILVSMMGEANNASGVEEFRACQADDVRQSLSETIYQIKSLALGVKVVNDPSDDALLKCEVPRSQLDGLTPALAQPAG